MRKTVAPTAHALLHPLALEVRHLRLVLALAQTGSLSRAAEVLHVTQSALSHQLRKLEVRLGIQAYVRTAAGLVPTHAGRSLVHLASRVLGELVDTELSLTKTSRGRLRIAAETYTHYDWLPGVLRRFEQRCPDVDVEVCLSCSESTLTHLRDGVIDLAFTRADCTAEDVEAWPLVTRELLLVGLASLLPHLERPYAEAHDLDGQRLILHSSSDRDLLCATLQPHLRAAAHIVQPSAAVIASAMAGLGLALLPEWITRDITAERGLSTWRLGHSGLRQTWSAAARRTPALPSYIASFVQCMRLPRQSP